jgi:hypothetical protein
MAASAAAAEGVSAESACGDFRAPFRLRCGAGTQLLQVGEQSILRTIEPVPYELAERDTAKTVSRDLWCIDQEPAGLPPGHHAAFFQTVKKSKHGGVRQRLSARERLMDCGYRGFVQRPKSLETTQFQGRWNLAAWGGTSHRTSAMPLRSAVRWLRAISRRRAIRERDGVPVWSSCRAVARANRQPSRPEWQGEGSGTVPS